MRGGLTGRVADVHLPSRKACSLQFLQQLAEGTKKMVDRAKVPANRVPQWPELVVRLLSPNVLADPQLKDYFPDKFRAGKAPERDRSMGMFLASRKEVERDGYLLRAGFTNGARRYWLERTRERKAQDEAEEKLRASFSEQSGSVKP